MRVGGGPGKGGAATGVGVGTRSGIGVIRIILISVAGLAGVIIGAVLVGSVLVFTGAPKPCADRTIPVSSAAAQESRARWNTFKAAAANGNAEVTFNESQITSRGVDWVDEKGAPVEDLQVYFCPQGYAEATGLVSLPGPDMKVLARGTLDLSGDKPRVQIDQINAGNLPPSVGTRLVNGVLDRTNVKALDLSVPIGSILFTDGEVELRSR